MKRPDWANEQLTTNFALYEFLESRFFNEAEQERVYRDFAALNVLHNIRELANNLQVLRDWLGYSISINIALRPKWYELSRGRSGTSKHVQGIAADIVASKYSPDQVHDAIEQLIEDGKMKEGGLGSYDVFTHYDLRGVKARWRL